MPKFFCDYCDVYLTHDSMSVRKAHNSGRNHLRNVVDYYQQIGHEKAQSVIDSITSSYAAEGQSNPMAGMSGAPGVAPPMGFGGPVPGSFGAPQGFGAGGPPPGMPPMPFGRGMPPLPPGFPPPPNGFPPGFNPNAAPPFMPPTPHGNAGSPLGGMPFPPPNMPFQPPAHFGQNGPSPGAGSHFSPPPGMGGPLGQVRQESR
ncbi:hypothetical protein LTR85_005978 [Meristemomyces frigidus]|nr:hypothetical protein LTR85_005978 [Meristemomyces frigidus]